LEGRVEEDKREVNRRREELANVESELARCERTMAVLASEEEQIGRRLTGIVAEIARAGGEAAGILRNADRAAYIEALREQEQGLQREREDVNLRVGGEAATVSPLRQEG